MRKHELKFTVHLDDYHSNITAWWPTIEGARSHVQSEIDNGYEVSRITLDGEPFTP